VAFSKTADRTTREEMIAAALGKLGRRRNERTSAADYPRLPTKPLGACVGGAGDANWPQVFQSDGVTPCYNKYANTAHMVGESPSETVMPGSTLHFSVADTPGGWPNHAAWLLSWNNLFDYEPLMRGSNGVVANDITGEDYLFKVPPGIDDSGCYDSSGGYEYGRFVSTCTLRFGKGPYYGTPAGKTIPYAVFTASTLANGARFNSPMAQNCGGTCPTTFTYYWPAYVETPIFIEPSPYAGFGTSQNGGTVNFTDYTASDLQITSWQWTFGDGTSSSEQNPIHNYAHNGAYQVTMTIHTIDGQTDNASTTIDVTSQYNLSGTVTDLSGNGVPTTLTLTNNGDSSTQQLNVGSDGTYSVAVDSGNYTLATDPTAPSGMFTPVSKTLAIHADTVANFTANTNRITATVTNNIGNPISNIAIPISGTGSIYGSLTTDSTGTAHAEATNGTYTLTPTNPHPGQGYKFSPKSRQVTIDNADASAAFQLNAAVFVDSVTPNVGPISGGTAVTVTGGGFEHGGSPSVSAVTFQSGPGKAVVGISVDVTSDSILTVTTPKALSLLPKNQSAVNTDVLVTSGPDTSSINSADQFTFGDVPIVTNVALDSGPVTGGTKIVVTGAHFTGATSVSFVPFDTLPTLKAKNFTVDSDAQISLAVPGMNTSVLEGIGQRIADVRLTTDNGTSPTSFADRYTFRPDNVVQLGDSIASGEGIKYGFTYSSSTATWTIGNPDPTWDGPYQNCHQTLNQAYSYYVNAGIYGNLTNFACTGATYLAGIEGAQPAEGAPAQFGDWTGPGTGTAAYDNANPDVVLISMGADDIVFSEVVADCVENYLFGTHGLVCIDSRPGSFVKNDYLANLPFVATHLTQLIHDIEARGEASPSGVAPKIVVQDYFNPFPTDTTLRCPDTYGLDPRQVEYLSGLVERLDAKIARAVDAIARSDKNVGFVELKNAFENNQWCSNDPMAYGISIRLPQYNNLSTNQAPFHPTPEGQQTIAQEVLPEVQSLIEPK
jgi:hypothetical protein